MHVWFNGACCCCSSSGSTTAGLRAVRWGDEMQLLRVLVCDPDPLIRAGIRGLVESVEYATVIAESSSIWSGREMCDDSYDVAVVTDGDIPPSAKNVILFIDDVHDRRALVNAVAAGVTRFVSRTNAATDLGHGLRAVLQGSPYVPTPVVEQLLALLAATIPTKASATRPIEELSPREAEVLMLISEGTSNAAIARKLHIQETTVRSHVARIQSKLNIATRAEAVLVGQRFRIEAGRDR
ncbi:response regulator transcription factor [Amycolatopsis tolypomycina]|nr:response regulator transcription factor [Amycolatopsis tolypomycina]